MAVIDVGGVRDVMLLKGEATTASRCKVVGGLLEHGIPVHTRCLILTDLQDPIYGFKALWIFRSAWPNSWRYLGALVEGCAKTTSQRTPGRMQW